MEKIPNLNTESSKNLVRYSIIFIILYAIILIYIDYINKTFWYDEAYTIALIKYSFQDIISITAKDVHPPLYYFLLKTFSNIFGNSLFVLHLFSCLGMISILLVGLFQIRRIFGNRISFLFILLVCVIPVSQYLGVEIRMYSWLMLFVLLSSIYAYEAITTNRKWAYFKFTIFALCSAYTHNYGLVAIGAIYLYIFTDLFLRKQNITTAVISLIIFACIYGLWVPTLFYQILDVNESFWIKTITLKDILLLSYYFFSPKEPSHPYLIFSKAEMSIFLSISLIIILLITIILIKKAISLRKQEIKQANYFLYIFIFTIGITLIISFLIKPILAPRFTTSVLGPLLLSVSIFVSSYWSSSKLLRNLCYCLLLSFCIASVARFFSEKRYFHLKLNDTEQLKSFIKQDNKIFIAPFDQYPELAKLSLQFPSNNFYLYSPNDSLSLGEYK